MANTASATKRNRQAQKRRTRNVQVRTGVKTAVKKVREALEKGDGAAAPGGPQAAERTIGKASSKGVVHKNAASRKISAAWLTPWPSSRPPSSAAGPRRPRAPGRRRTPRTRRPAPGRPRPRGAERLRPPRLALQGVGAGQVVRLAPRPTAPPPRGRRPSAAPAPRGRAAGWPPAGRAARARRSAPPRRCGPRPSPRRGAAPRQLLPQRRRHLGAHRRVGGAVLEGRTATAPAPPRSRSPPADGVAAAATAERASTARAPRARGAGSPPTPPPRS